MKKYQISSTINCSYKKQLAFDYQSQIKKLHIKIAQMLKHNTYELLE